MVWFQCEACGENLKKPKLLNHFRICSAYKLSCIDCGQVFDQHTVQSHTQCISEAEKYGPKGLAKTAGSTPAKANKDKPKPDVDINVGLSQRPPWFCSLCNTQATSQQTLLLHADGKKHRAKARAYAAKQQPSPPDEGAVTNKDSTEVTNDNSRENGKVNDASNGSLGHDNCPAVNGNVSQNKRKKDASNDTEKHANGLDTGTATQVEAEDVPKKSKKAKQESQVKGGNKEDSKQKVKWKKLITSVLKSTPERALKMKKLQKLVSKSLMESGITVDDSEFKTIIEHKVNSSSKFELDGKHVKLAC